METPTYFLPRDLDDEPRPFPEELDDADLVDLFQRMVLLRTFDERAVVLQRQGRLGNYPPCWGEEATQVGPLSASRDQDWLFPSYRQQGLPILRGVAPSTILKYRRGIGGSMGFWDPRAHRCAPISISIATHLPHAVGLAWAARIRGDATASIVWFGDGATSEGDFHEALNLAAVLKTPTVFFCTNNQWAISTPFERQTATATVAEKAVAYGLPSDRVDGFDVIACWYAAQQALLRARNGGGPTLIEALTFRLGPHATADDPTRYRDQAEVDRIWKPLEPIERLARFLRSKDRLSQNQEDEIRAHAKRVVDEAVRDLDATVVPGPEVLFETTYATGRPWTFEEALLEFKN
jgi:pyruvate dehydrogenase E1 component alpha subunit